MQLAVYLQQSPRGEAARLAREIDVPPSHISEYVRGERQVPPKKAIALEKATGFRVLRECLRDDWRDYWPDLIPLRRIESQSVAAA
jgi:DNA-binding transcriptional regulator YdaS (Cro superfamily)